MIMRDDAIGMSICVFWYSCLYPGLGLAGSWDRKNRSYGWDGIGYLMILVDGWRGRIAALLYFGMARATWNRSNDFCCVLVSVPGIVPVLELVCLRLYLELWRNLDRGMNPRPNSRWK
jgi:hypothetical protein